ncbi:MAG: phosphonate ABC transporter, permease protein PhnE [Chloroflexi bacterium]|nr:phosphonate ABC transporter, permease protein PhnE [Chloroflexota bacterium]
METSTTLRVPAKNASFVPILSLVIPGAGQIYLKQTWRGISILLTTIILAALVNWGLDNGKIGLITLGTFETSWLWIPLALFVLWNVLDAQRLATGKQSPTWLGLLLAAFVLYYLAWTVTDIKPDRLITRFQDARAIMNELIHPDLFVQDETTGAISPSENFGDIFGRVADTPAPGWMVTLRLATEGQAIPTYKPGSLIETIAIGLLATIFSTILAIPVSFFAAHNIMSRVPGGTIVYYVARGLLNIVRAVDTLIWGVLVIVWVGLGDFAGILALTIHSIAALAKLYSEEIEHIDMGPVEAITATGANLLQTVRYAVIPQIIPPFLSYTLLRWDINMRSATVVGFVAGGGIGFFVLETVRKGAYNQYAAALWAIAIVIILVDYISSTLSERIRAGDTHVQDVSPRPFWRSPRNLMLLVLGLAIFYYSWYITRIDIRTLLEPAPTFIRLVQDFLSIDTSSNIADIVMKQMIITVFQALLATTLGAFAAIPFSFLAARNLTGRNRLSIWIYYLARGIFDVLRSIEALLYVAIFVFWVGIGPFAGTLALAVTSFALVGKLYADAIENIDMGPMEAITATGANRLQAIVYAILPQIVPPFVSYSIYQWDINVRMATIIGFAGGGGIGLLLNTYFGQLQYHRAGTIVAVIVLVVALLDFASAKIRERMV